MRCDVDFWGNVAQWAGAIGTLLAVCIALFRDLLYKKFYHPELVCTIKLAPPDSIKTLSIYKPAPIVAPKQIEGYHFRLWVSNEGNVRAEKIQVFAEKITRKLPDGTFTPVDNFLPMNFVWANTHEVFAEGIAPSMGKHCDLCHIADPSALVDLGENLNDVSAGKTILALDLEVKPFTNNHLLPPGTYNLTLKIAGANSLPKSYTLEITITGDWYDKEAKMFTDGIRIKILG
jgi:hypothetical protein